VCLHVQGQVTPLHEAARNGHETVTRALVEAGAYVNARAKIIFWVQSKCAVVGCVLMGVVTEAAWWRVAACADAEDPAV